MTDPYRGIYRQDPGELWAAQDQLDQAPHGYRPPQPPDSHGPPGSHRGLMAAAIVVMAVVVVAALALYVIHRKRPSRAAAAAVTTMSCRQQYQAWKTGPARAKGKQLTRALNSVQSAGDDINLIRTRLRRAGIVAHQLQAYPMPHCADPAGYWARLLADIRAAGDNAGAVTGLVGVVAAEGPLKKVPRLERKLQRELKTTTA